MAINFTSQLKLFVDFSATAGGSGGAAVWVQDAETGKVTDERDVEIIKAIGVDGGAGYRRKTGGGSFNLTVNRSANPSVRWRKVKKDQKIFMMMAQDENSGPREKWFSCTVAKVGRSMNADGEHQDEVEIKFLQSVES